MTTVIASASVPWPMATVIVCGEAPAEGAAMSTTSQSTLEGQRALVTGATSGIGRAIALQLARDGAEVIVHGRDANRGADTVKAILGEGGRARFVRAELSDPADLQRLVEDVGDDVDVLVNSAGFSWFGPTADLDIDTFDEIFASDVRAPYFLVAALAPKDGDPREGQ